MSPIFLIGGSGFVGRHVAVALLEAEQRVAAPSHDEFDIAREEPAALARKLAGSQIVVNCAGLARNARIDNLEAVHVEGVRRLAQACRLAGVRRLVHLSTLGAGRDDATRLQRTKGEAEDILGAVEGLEVSIVRPSLLIGRGGSTGDFFSALAALPFPPRLGPGTWRVQPLHVAELAGLVAKLALAPQAPKSVDAVGPTAMTTDELERGLRAWLGLTQARFLPLSRAVLDGLAWLNEIIEVGPGDRELIELLERGNVASPEGVAAALGRGPRSLAESLALSPATTADLWRARLYFVQPFLRIALALLWIGTGIVSLGLFPPAESYVMLAEVGVRGPLAEVALFGGAAANLVLGGLLLVAWRPARIGLAMLALLVAYSLVGLLLPPEYWLNPFAPILKNLPIAGALIAMIAMERPNGAARRPSIEGRG